MTTGQAKFWIGPSGWSYEDWYGIVYPEPAPRGFKPLGYLAQFFNAVEVNSSFYRIPSPRTTAAWVSLVPSDFRLTFKLTQIFTHQRADFPPPEEVRAFKEALKPVAEANRLGPLLIQFPWSFRYSPQAAEWLARLADAFGEYERFFEVRHSSWARPEGLQAIATCGGFCNIDQPKLRSCLRPTTHVFGESAYVRLHGRNAQHWFAENQPAFERYNYLYSTEELREWADRLDLLAAKARQVYVFANNHYKGQGPANALELRALLERRQVDVPRELMGAYPRLAEIARPTAPAGLFDDPR